MFLAEKILKSYLGQVQGHGTDALDFRLRTPCRGNPDSSGATPSHKHHTTHKWQTSWGAQQKNM